MVFFFFFFGGGGVGVLGTTIKRTQQRRSDKAFLEQDRLAKILLHGASWIKTSAGMAVTAPIQTGP